MGNVMSTVFAGGRAANCAGSGLGSCSSKANEIVSDLGFEGRDVAAYDTPRELHRGMRNVDVQPAPRMRTSTGSLVCVDMRVACEEIPSDCASLLRAIRQYGNINHTRLHSLNNFPSTVWGSQIQKADDPCQMKGPEK